MTNRFADVGEFLEHLDEIPNGCAEPASAEPDPWDATKGTELPDGYVVLNVLGTGATARALHMTRDGLESVLKVGRSAQAEERLADEATALEGLRNEHLVMLKRGVFPLGTRHAIELDHAGARTLAQVLREDGALVPDQLRLTGSQRSTLANYSRRAAREMWSARRMGSGNRYCEHNASTMSPACPIPMACPGEM